MTKKQDFIQTENKLKQIQTIISLALFLLGVILLILALAADRIGLNHTPGFGVVQMLELLFGLTSLTLATFIILKKLRPNDSPQSLQANIAVRLIATGLVFLYINGLADLIGIGTHINPTFERPFVGPLQLGGFAIGILTILFGLFLYHTSRGKRKNSSMEFLLNGKEE